MRPKSVWHVIFFLAGLGCFALPFFNVSCVKADGTSERVARVEGYKFVIGGQPSSNTPLAAETVEALSAVQQQAVETVRSLPGAGFAERRAEVPGDWRGWLGAFGLLVGVVALLARLPLGNFLAGLGGLASLAGLGVLAYENREFISTPVSLPFNGQTLQAGLQVEVAYGLLLAMLCAFLGLMFSWVGLNRAKKD